MQVNEAFHLYGSGEVYACRDVEMAATLFAELTDGFGKGFRAVRDPITYGTKVCERHRECGDVGSCWLSHSNGQVLIQRAMVSGLQCDAEEHAQQR